MYGWITGSWNPISGECPHFCDYCYVKNFRFPSLKEKYSGPPRLCENELKRTLGKDKFWFVGSCFDIFAREVPGEWIRKILEHCRAFDNRYLFQSKNPMRFIGHRTRFPKNTVLGTTIESNIHHPEMGDAPDVFKRMAALRALSSFRKTVTVEPIMDFTVPSLSNLIKLCKPDWVNIGGNTNQGVRLPEPDPGKIKELIKQLRKITEVKIKPNLKRLYNPK